MNIRKIRSVVAFLVGELQKKKIPIKRMGPEARFSRNQKVAQRQMLAHAHWLLAVSLSELLQERRRLRSRSGHCKIGRHLGAAQTMLWTSGMYTRNDLMNQNRKENPSKR